MGTHPIFESDFDCLTECLPVPLPPALLFPLAVDTPQLHSPQIISQFWADLIQQGNWTDGEWVLMEEGDHVWIPTNKAPESLAEVQFDNSRKKFSLHAAGLKPAHYEMIFSLTAIGYVLFTLYDWREEAKHSEAHGH